MRWTICAYLLVCLASSLSSYTWSGHNKTCMIDKEAVESLCAAQCQAWCYDDMQSCQSQCEGLKGKYLLRQPALWSVNCSDRERHVNHERHPNHEKYPTCTDCVGSCFKSEIGYVPQHPDVIIARDSATKTVTLSWNPDLLATSHIVYIVYQQQSNAYKDAWQQIDRVRENYSSITSILDMCITPEFRVTAVSRYGSRWFSRSVKTPALLPGPSLAVNLTKLVYNESTTHITPRATTGIIYYKLQWLPPEGWPASDIRLSHKVQVLNANCHKKISEPIIIFTEHCRPVRGEKGPDYFTVSETKPSNSLECNATFTGHVFTIEGRFPLQTLNCTITFTIRSISVCDETHIGAPQNYTFDLKCDKFPTYTGRECETPFVEPGPVKSLKMDIVQTVDGLIGLVSWRPPSALGSAGKVALYSLYWGIGAGGLIGGFDILLGNRTVPGTQHGEYIFMKVTALHSSEITGIYTQNGVLTNITSFDSQQKIGIYVRAAGPGQVIDEAFGDIYWVNFPYPIGTVLSNNGKVIVVQTDNDFESQNETQSAEVQIYWRSDELEKGVNFTAEEYSLLWGEMDQHLFDNNTSLLDSKTYFKSTNVTLVSEGHVSVGDLSFNTTYGFKIIPLASKNSSLPQENDEDWNKAELRVFKTLIWNETADSGKNRDDPTISTTLSEATRPPEQQTTGKEEAIILSIAITLVVLTTTLIFACVYVRKHRSLSLLFYKSARDPEAYSYFTPGASLGTTCPSNCPVVADQWELPLSSVKFGPVLGSGAFGQVVRGRVTRAMLTSRGVATGLADKVASLRNGDKLHVAVAIKLLQENCDSRYKQDFLQEIELMKKIGSHENVVAMLGCCTLREPICLVVEHMQLGDLLTFLKDIRQKLRSRIQDDISYVNEDVEVLGPIDLLKFALDISLGMDFLASKGFVHRDLAARNVLVGANKICKIGDFGLARYVYNNAVYVNRRGGKLPVKWMSTEAIFDMSFSIASDVWSFGIVLYEIVTLGGTPYPTIPARELLRELQCGYRMARPDNCSLETYQMMLQCWEEEPAQRPSFLMLSACLKQMIADESGVKYIDVIHGLQENVYNVDKDDNEEDVTVLRAMFDSASYHVSKSGTDHKQEGSGGSSYLDSGYASPQKESTSSKESSGTNNSHSIAAEITQDDQRTLCVTAEYVLNEKFVDDVFHAEHRRTDEVAYEKSDLHHECRPEKHDSTRKTYAKISKNLATSKKKKTPLRLTKRAKEKRYIRNKIKRCSVVMPSVLGLEHVLYRVNKSLHLQNQQPVKLLGKTPENCPATSLNSENENYTAC